MTYQSIWGFGDSNSIAKLSALSLPDLKGKTFLDIGCNEGFFCGFAVASGANSAVGVDFNEEAITRARNNFKKAKFVNTDWDNFLESNQSKFDVILCSSALHYAKDQGEMILSMLSHLSSQGTLVLEAGVILDAEEGTDYISVDRWDGPKLYPTLSHIKSLVRPQGFAVFQVMPSVIQPGDAVARYVLHIRRRQTPILLNFDPTDRGKTELGVILSEQGVDWHSIDAIILNMVNTKNNPFLNLIGPDPVTLQNYMDKNEIVKEIIDRILERDEGTISYVEGFVTDEIKDVLVNEIRRMSLPYYTISSGNNNFVSKVPGKNQSVMTEKGVIFLTKSENFGYIDSFNLLSRPPHCGAILSGWMQRNLELHESEEGEVFFLSIANINTVGYVVKKFERSDVGSNGIGFEAYVPLTDEIVKSIGLERVIPAAPLSAGVVGAGRELYPLEFDRNVFLNYSTKSRFL